jgi:predicted small lipoprotein YifL
MKNSVKISAAILMISYAIFLTGCGSKGIPANLHTTLDQYTGYWNSG